MPKMRIIERPCLLLMRSDGMRDTTAAQNALRSAAKGEEQRAHLFRPSENATIAHGRTVGNGGERGSGLLRPVVRVELGHIGESLAQLSPSAHARLLCPFLPLCGRNWRRLRLRGCTLVSHWNGGHTRLPRKGFAQPRNRSDSTRGSNAQSPLKQRHIRWGLKAKQQPVVFPLEQTQLIERMLDRIVVYASK
eukprot:2939727-Prymnesium_polylepis.1